MAGPGACYTDADLEGKKKDSIYHQVKEFLDKGETLAVATIVSTKGSTPREVGAKMVVVKVGLFLMTVNVSLVTSAGALLLASPVKETTQW